MKNRLIIIVVALLAITGVSYGVYTRTTAASPQPVETATNVLKRQPVVLNDSHMIAIVNEYRAKAGVAPLTESAALDATAQAKCNQMIADHLFGHEDRNGKHNGYDSIPVDVPSATIWGENLNAARAQNDSEPIGAWYYETGTTETGHRTNMLNPRFKLTGIAHCTDPNDDSPLGKTITVVEHFAD